MTAQHYNDLSLASSKKQFAILKAEIQSLKSELDRQYHTVEALNIENNKTKKELKIATQTSQDMLKTEIESLKKELQRRKDSVLISSQNENLKKQIHDLRDELENYDSIDFYSAPSDFSPFRRSPYE